jgi:hypothetical protein
MSTSIREQILTAFTTVISTDLPIAIPGTDVERNRSRPVPKTSDAFVILYDGAQFIVSDETCATRYTMDVDAEGYVKAATDALIGPAINNLYGELTKAALADHTLGGLAIDVRESNLQDVYIDDESQKPSAAFAVTFNITYSTAGGDPFTLGV